MRRITDWFMLAMMGFAVVFAARVAVITGNTIWVLICGLQIVLLVAALIVMERKEHE